MSLPLFILTWNCDCIIINFIWKIKMSNLQQVCLFLIDFSVVYMWLKSWRRILLCIPYKLCVCATTVFFYLSRFLHSFFQLIIFVLDINIRIWAFVRASYFNLLNYIGTVSTKLDFACNAQFHFDEWCIQFSIGCSLLLLLLYIFFVYFGWLKRNCVCVFFCSSSRIKYDLRQKIVHTRTHAQ